MHRKFAVASKPQAGTSYGPAVAVSDSRSVIFAMGSFLPDLSDTRSVK
ncbi:hypothetical protein ABER23_21015 [Paenibacillus lautus]